MKLIDYINTTSVLPFIKPDYLDETQDKNPVRKSDFQSTLTDFMLLNFGDLELNERLVNVTDVTTTVRSILTAMYKGYEYRYKTLYETTIQEYNPIENYSMIEETTTEYSGGETRTNSKQGKETNTITMSGSESESHAVGEIASSSVDQTSPFDSSEFVNTSRTDDHTSAYNDNKTKSYNNRIDTNELDFTARQDVETSLYNDRVDKITHSRSGNIGIMTPKDMLESQRQLAEFDFLSVVAHDIIKKICIAIY